MLADKSSEISSLLNEFPASINILVVDSNLITLLDMKKIMKQYAYEVMIYSDAEEAEAFLTNCKEKIDIVIWDFHMPKINGLEALKIIGSIKMDLPVVIMSDENQLESVMKATIRGACDYVMKPVREEVIANIWQHVVRKRMMSKPGLTQPVQSDLVQSHGLDQDNDDSKTVDQDNGEQNIGKEEEKAAKKPRMMCTGLPQLVQSDLVQTNGLDQDNDDFIKTIYQDYGEQSIYNEVDKEHRMMCTSFIQPVQSDLVQTNGLYQDNGIHNFDKKEGKKPRKPRMTWTGDLHQKFLQAIEIVGGLEKANPMLVLKCLKEMKIGGLTRNNVASHLQKHRINLEENRIPQQTLSIGRSTAYRSSSLLGPTNDHSSMPYLMNGRAMNPTINQNQYPSGYLTMNNNQLMTNPLPRLPYLDHHHLQQQQQQQQYQFSDQLDYVMNKKGPEQAYGTDRELTYPSLQYDPKELQQQQQYQFSHQLDYVMNKKGPEQTYGTDRELTYPSLQYDPKELQQQQQYQFSHQLDYVMNKKGPEQAYGTDRELTYPSLQYDSKELQQQQQYQFSHQLDYVMNKKEPEQAYGTDRELIYPNLPYDPK